MIIKLKLATLPSGEIDVAQCGLVGRSTVNPSVEELIENVSVGSLTLNADGLPTLTLVVFNPTVSLTESRSFLGREREPMSTKEDGEKKCYNPDDYDLANYDLEIRPLKKEIGKRDL